MKRQLIMLAALVPFYFVGCKPDEGKKPTLGDAPALPKVTPDPAKSDALLVFVRGDVVEVSRDRGQSWSVSPLPGSCRRPSLAASGGSPWLLAHIDGKDPVHRFAWDSAQGAWKDEGAVLDGGPEFRIFWIYRKTEQTVLRGGRGEVQDRTWASSDEGKTWKALEAEPAWLDPGAEFAELRSSAVKVARLKPGSTNVNDADLWQDPGDPKRWVACAFGNSGPALHDANSRILVTYDRGQTWREIEGPAGSSVWPVEIAGSGESAIGFFVARSARDSWSTYDFGKTWIPGHREARVYNVPSWRASIVVRFP